MQDQITKFERLRALCIGGKQVSGSFTPAPVGCCRFPWIIPYRPAPRFRDEQADPCLTPGMPTGSNQVRFLG